MNHLSIFFNTQIQAFNPKVTPYTYLHHIGCSFLIPFRFLFSGKTICLKEDGNIKRVTSFFLDRQRGHFFSGRTKFADGSNYKHPKQSFMNYEEASYVLGTGWGRSRAGLLLRPLFALILLVPFTFIGSILKLLSYLSPEVREEHRKVKEMLTPTDKTMIGKTGKLLSAKALKERLQEYLWTGKKTAALIIHAKPSAADADCQKLMRKINPVKLILVGNWNKQNFSFGKVLQKAGKKKKWDISALSPAAQDQSTSNIVNSVETARTTKPSFFARKHTVYVVPRKADLLRLLP